MSDMATEPGLRKFTVDEFHQLAQAGVLRDEERVELLDGLLVEMTPIGQRHWARHGALVAYLNTTLAGDAFIAGQGSFPLGEWNEPQPDVAVLAPRNYARADQPLTPADIYAIVEISDTSLRKDTGAKARLYARFAVPDYLVVDLGENALHHYHDPHDLAYRLRNIYDENDTFRLTRLPGHPLSAAAFLESS